MGKNESEQNNRALKLLLLGVWALYALIAFLVNHVPNGEQLVSAAPEQTDTAPAAKPYRKVPHRQNGSAQAALRAQPGTKTN